jgi:MFS family permease
MKRLKLPDLLVLNLYWVGISFKWNTLHVLLLPALLLQYVPEGQKNTALGLLTFGGLVVAMLVQPLSGAWSDRWQSAWGRRRPLILAGTLAELVFLAVLGWMGGLAWLVVGYFGLQVFSNLAHGPAQGLLPDRVPPAQLGAASAVKNLLDMVGLVVASLWMGRLIAPDGSNPALPVTVILVVVVASTLVTLLGVRERSSLPAAPPQSAALQSAEPPPTSSLRPSPAYAWLLASRFAFLLSIYMIQAFAQYYVRDVLQAPNPVQLTGDLLAALTLALIVFALLGGWLGDRLGHRRLLAAASVVGTLGCLLLLLARTPLALLAYGSVLGAAVGLFLTANWALAARLSPPAASGWFLGLTNLATAGAGAAARLAGPAIDGLNAANPGQYLCYTALFLFGAAAVLVSGLLLVKVRLDDKEERPSLTQQIGPSD